MTDLEKQLINIPDDEAGYNFRKLLKEMISELELLDERLTDIEESTSSLEWTVFELEEQIQKLEDQLPDE